jgi:hypothetical protein
VVKTFPKLNALMKRRLKQNASDLKRKLLKLKPIELLPKKLPHKLPHRQRPKELLQKKLPQKQRQNASDKLRPNNALKEILPLKPDAEQRPKQEGSLPMVPTKLLLALGKQMAVSLMFLHTMTVTTMEELTSEPEVVQRRNSLISVSMTFT